MKNNKLHVFETPEDLANQFADQLMYWVKNHTEKTFHLAISGGKTPKLLFVALAKKYADSELWEKVHFWWVDERMVSPYDPESNYKVANKTLFSKINIHSANIHRIKGENDPISEVISYTTQAQKRIAKTNGWPIFDLILLGMGEDGHTASIFPDQMQLLNSNNIYDIAHHPKSGQKRITLTGQAIGYASKICILVTGSDKANRIADIWSDSENAKQSPIALIHSAKNNIIWHLDKAAAHLIMS